MCRLAITQRLDIFVGQILYADKGSHRRTSVLAHSLTARSSDRHVVFVTSTRVHAHRAACGHRDHRRVDRALASRGSSRP